MRGKSKVLLVLVALCVALALTATTALAASNTDCPGGDACQHEAAIGSTHYDTLEEAIGEANTDSGCVVKLLTNVEISTPITMSGAYTLDLNDKIVTAAEDTMAGSNGTQCIFTTKGDITIQDGSINSTVCRGIYVYSGEFKLNNVDMTTYKRALMIDNALATVDQNCVLSIGEGGMDAAIVVWGTGNYETDSISQHPTLHFYGTADSTMAVNSYAAISGNGTDRSYTYIYIYDGAELKSNGHALYVPQPGDVYISGGILTGSGAIGMKSGKLIITGGTLIATGEYDENIETSSNGIANDGSVINIDSNSGYAGEMIIEICGDAVLRSENGHAIREIGKDEDQTSVVSLDITDGNFIAADDKNALVLRAITQDNVAVSGGGVFEPGGRRISGS